MGKKIGSLYWEIGGDTTKLKTGISDSTKQVSGLGGKMKAVAQTTKASLLEINAGVELVQQGMRLMAQGYDVLIGETMEYAATVRQMSRISGQSTEETSRMIQMADDLTISEESLTAAMRGAAMKGIAFTTENLAKLSDEYRAMEDPAERAEFLVKSFGRSGLEMAKMMEVGSEGIRGMSDAIADNMVLTEAQVAKARELEIAQDNLNDAMTGLKYTIGNALIPVLVDAANAFQILLTQQETFFNLAKKHDKDVALSARTYEEYVTETQLGAEAAGLYTGELSFGEKILSDFRKGLTGTSLEMRVMSEAEWENVAATDAEVERWKNHQAAVQNFGVVLDDSAVQASNHADAISRYYGNLVNSYQPVMDQLNNIKALQGDLITAQQGLTTAQENYAKGLAGQAVSGLKEYNLSNEKRLAGEEAVDKQLGTNFATLDKQQLAIDDVNKKYAEGKLSAEEYGNQIASIKEKFMPFDESVKNAQYQVDLLNSKLLVTKARIDMLNGSTISISVDYADNGPSGAVGKIAGATPQGNKGGLKDYASGGSFRVPPGYPNDTYPLGPMGNASSGETVTITPPGQSPTPAINVYILGNVDSAERGYQIAEDFAERIQRRLN